MNIPDRVAGAIVAGKFSAREYKGKALVTAECKPGDRIQIVEVNGKLEAKPVVFVAFNRDESPAARVSEFLKRVYKIEKAANELCFRHPAFAPDLLVYGYATGSGPCSANMVLAQDATGALMRVDEGGFAWPEPYVDAQVARGGADAVRAAEAWTRQVTWASTPLEVPTAEFKLKFAPPFSAPRTSTQGDEVWVEAWYANGLGCQYHTRAIHNAVKHERREKEVEWFCVEKNGDVIVRQPDGQKLRNGTLVK